MGNGIEDIKKDSLQCWNDDSQGWSKVTGNGVNERHKHCVDRCEGGCCMPSDKQGPSVLLPSRIDCKRSGGGVAAA